MSCELTWCFSRGSSSLRSLSATGITKANVLPDPVHASTATSLFPENAGMTASWTGVGVLKPSVVSMSRMGWDRDSMLPKFVRLIVRLRIERCSTPAKQAARRGDRSSLHLLHSRLACIWQESFCAAAQRGRHTQYPRFSRILALQYRCVAAAFTQNRKSADITCSLASRKVTCQKVQPKHCNLSLMSQMFITEIQTLVADQKKLGCGLSI